VADDHFLLRRGVTEARRPLKPTGAGAEPAAAAIFLWGLGLHSVVAFLAGRNFRRARYPQAPPFSPGLVYRKSSRLTRLRSGEPWECKSPGRDQFCSETSLHMQAWRSQQRGGSPVRSPGRNSRRLHQSFPRPIRPPARSPPSQGGAGGAAPSWDATFSCAVGLTAERATHNRQGGGSTPPPRTTPRPCEPVIFSLP
jgi:hypothetical protein